jgi:hypothetical protein
MSARRKVRNCEEEYQVVWKGYPESQATFEPLSSLTEAAGVIDAFNSAEKKRKADAVIERAAKRAAVTKAADDETARLDLERRSPYEKERLATIENNRLVLETLGLQSPAAEPLVHDTHTNNRPNEHGFAKGARCRVKLLSYGINYGSISRINGALYMVIFDDGDERGWFPSGTIKKSQQVELVVG